MFTKHAREKFVILARHGVRVTEKIVRDAIERPKKIDCSRLPLLIAQIAFDERRVLRVVYRQEGAVQTIITFYPGRRSQYEKN